MRGTTECSTIIGTFSLTDRVKGMKKCTLSKVRRILQKVHLNLGPLFSGLLKVPAHPLPMGPEWVTGFFELCTDCLTLSFDLVSCTGHFKSLSPTGVRNLTYLGTCLQFENKAQTDHYKTELHPIWMVFGAVIVKDVLFWYFRHSFHQRPMILLGSDR